MPLSPVTSRGRLRRVGLRGLPRSHAPTRVAPATVSPATVAGADRVSVSVCRDGSSCDRCYGNARVVTRHGDNPESRFCPVHWSLLRRDYALGSVPVLYSPDAEVFAG